MQKCSNLSHHRALSHVNMAKWTGKDTFSKECSAVHSPHYNGTEPLLKTIWEVTEVISRAVGMLSAMQRSTCTERAEALEALAAAAAGWSRERREEKRVRWLLLLVPRWCQSSLISRRAAATIDINNEQIGLGSAGYQIIIMQEVNCIVQVCCVSNLARRAGTKPFSYFGSHLPLMKHTRAFFHQLLCVFVLRTRPHQHTL